MGIIKGENIIAWQEGEKILCTDREESGKAKPFTEEDFDQDDIVICDECGKRIK